MKNHAKTLMDIRLKNQTKKTYNHPLSQIRERTKWWLRLTSSMLRALTRKTRKYTKMSAWNARKSQIPSLVAPITPAQASWRRIIEMRKPQTLRKMKRKILLTSQTKPLHSHMTARTSFLRLQRTFNNSRRESPHFSQSQRRTSMLTKLKASLEVNLLSVTSALVTITRLKFYKAKTKKVLST